MYQMYKLHLLYTKKSVQNQGLLYFLILKKPFYALLKIAPSMYSNDGLFSQVLTLAKD